MLIYGIPTRIKEMGLLDRTGQGNHIYRVKYDGQQMALVEDIAESTGIGLGVHTVIYPDAGGFACADGQKDIAAFFNRARGPEKTKVQMAFRGDWRPKDSSSLERGWSGGGTLAPRARRAEGDRQVRVRGHQGEQDQLGDGADGRSCSSSAARSPAIRRRPSPASTQSSTTPTTDGRP